MAGQSERVLLLAVPLKRFWIGVVRETVDLDRYVSGLIPQLAVEMEKFPRYNLDD